MSNSLPKKLRRDSTDAERKLWRAIRNRQLGGHKFRRQHPIGKFIVDFCCVEQAFVVELDGGQHDIQSAQDAARTGEIESLGYRVIRFWNNEVLQNLEGILFVMERELSKEDY